MKRSTFFKSFAALMIAPGAIAKTMFSLPKVSPTLIAANVPKMGVYMRVCEEMLDDIPYLTAYLGKIGEEDILKEMAS